MPALFDTTVRSLTPLFLDRLDQRRRDAAQAEAAGHDQHPVPQQPSQRRLRIGVNLVRHPSPGAFPTSAGTIAQRAQPVSTRCWRRKPSSGSRASRGSRRARHPRRRTAGSRGPPADKRRRSTAPPPPPPARYASRNASLNARMAQAGTGEVAPNLLCRRACRPLRSRAMWARPRSVSSWVRAAARFGGLSNQASSQTSSWSAPMTRAAGSRMRPAFSPASAIAVSSGLAPSARIEPFTAASSIRAGRVSNRSPAAAALRPGRRTGWPG